MPPDGRYDSYGARQALDVDVRVSRGGTMEESSAGAVLEHITQILEDPLTPSGMDQWLRSRNRMLGGGRPADLLDDGDAARVEEAARVSPRARTSDLARPPPPASSSTRAWSVSWSPPLRTTTRACGRPTTT